MKELGAKGNFQHKADLSDVFIKLLLSNESSHIEGLIRYTVPGILSPEFPVQYRSSEYQFLLINNRIRPSMSRKGNCWDNAVMESFFARLKVESIYAEQFKGKQDAYSCVFEYIEIFYNSIRRHSANDYKSPNTIEQEYDEQCA